MRDSGLISEDQNAGSNAVGKVKDQKVLFGTFLAVGLQLLDVMLSWEVCLHFPHILRFCRRLRLREEDQLIWQRKLQHNQMFTLYNMDTVCLF